jgi:two-component system chemotaxis response regulator CheB
MGASVGGLSGMIAVLSALPPEFPVPVVLVQHLAPTFPSELAAILGRKTGRTVVTARHGDVLDAGVTYVAPPDRHLLVDAGGKLRLHHGPRVNFSRPAIDVLFCSAAEACRGQVIAVILTGANRDGAAGVRAVKRAGGSVLVQDERQLPHSRMPQAARATGCVDFALPVASIPHALVSLAMVPGAAALFRAPAPPGAA